MTTTDLTPETALVRWDLREGIARITLDSPRNRNALSRQLVSELSHYIHTAIDDRSVRAVVITGTDKAFCAGADLSEQRGIAAPKVGDEPAGRDVRDILLTIMRSDLTFVAAVNGAVRAGGTGIVAACDIALASRSVRFAIPEVRLALPPAQILVPLQRTVDRRALRRYILTGETFDADEAARIGLITAAVDDLDSSLESVLDGLRAAHPGALRRVKRLMEETAPLDPALGLRLAGDVAAEWFAGPDAQEGIAAVLEKRRPSWASTYD